MRALRLIALACAVIAALAAGSAVERAGASHVSLVSSFALPTIGCTAVTTATLELALPPNTPAPSLPSFLDIVLVLDESGSVGSANFNLVKGFADSLAQSFAFGPTQAAMGVVAFGSTARSIVGLTTSQASVRNAINGAAYSAGASTNTDAGLQAALAQLAAAGRPGATDLIVLVTDGVNNSGADPFPTAQAFRAGGGRLIAVGVGNGVDLPFLQALAGPDDAVHVGGFTALNANLIVSRLGRSAWANDLSYEVELAPEFELVAARATHGDVEVAGDGFTWTLDVLGPATTVEYDVRYLGSTTATLPLHATAALTWTDIHDVEHPVSFADRLAVVDCDSPPPPPPEPPPSTGTDVASTLTATSPVACSADSVVTLVLGPSAAAPAPVLTKPFDVMLVLDESGSIDANEFRQLKDAAIDLARSVSFAPDRVRMGVAAFGTTSRLVLPLSASQGSVVNTLNGMAQRGGSTNTNAGLQTAIGELAANGRAGVQPLLVLITDGVNNTGGDPVPTAEAFRASGGRLFGIGVGANVDTAFIRSLSGNDDAYSVGAFTALPTLFRELMLSLGGGWADDLRFAASPGDGFEIHSPAADHGTVELDGPSLEWSFPFLNRTTTLTYRVRNVASPGGSVPLHTAAELTFSLGPGMPVTRTFAPLVDAAACATDTTPPSVTPVLAGTLGNASWFVSDATVSWVVEEAESDATPCAPTTIAVDTPGTTVTCTSTSEGGTTTVSVTVKRDATAPALAFTGNAGVYGVNDVVRIGCTAGDGGSGLASSDCPTVDAPAWSFGAASVTLTGSALDVAGNRGLASTMLSVDVDASGLCGLTRQFVADRSIARSLCTKLANGNIGEYRDRVRSLSVRQITPEHAAALIGLSNALAAG